MAIVLKWIQQRSPYNEILGHIDEFHMLIKQHFKIFHVDLTEFSYLKTKHNSNVRRCETQDLHSMLRPLWVHNLPHSKLLEIILHSHNTVSTIMCKVRCQFLKKSSEIEQTKYGNDYGSQIINMLCHKEQTQHTVHQV